MHVFNLELEQQEEITSEFLALTGWNATYPSYLCLEGRIYAEYTKVAPRRADETGSSVALLDLEVTKSEFVLLFIYFIIHTRSFSLCSYGIDQS